MKNILPKELKIKFVETLSELDDFRYQEGNPFLITIGTEPYFIFLKNLSPAYMKGSPNVTRVQLPQSERFTKIFTSDIPFVILGYDIDNDVVVCWHPDKVKERLNAKSNVSLYSRETLQLSVKEDEFKEGYLSNKEKIILFKRPKLVDFFSHLNQLFAENDIKPEAKTDHNSPYVVGKITEIHDADLIAQIEPLLKGNQVFKAAEIVYDYYGDVYVNMGLKDWFHLLNELYKKIKADASI